MFKRKAHVVYNHVFLEQSLEIFFFFIKFSSFILIFHKNITKR